MSQFILSLVFSVLFLAPAQAAVPAGTLEESAPPSKPLINLDLFGWTYTNAFNNWDGRTPKSDGTSGDPMQIITQFTAHTHMVGKFDFEVTPQFIIQPMQGQRFQLLDPTVGVQAVVAESGGFSYWARYEAALPLVEKSRNDGTIMIPQAINVVSYRFEGTPIKTELVFIPSVNIKSTGATGGIFISPRVYYLLTDSVWFMSIMQFGYESKKDLLSLYTTGPASLGVGMRFLANAGKGLWIQPFANFYANEKAATTAHLGVTFGGPLL